MLVGGVWMLVLALFLLSCGLCAMVSYIAYPLIERARANLLETNMMFGSIAGLGLLLGTLLLWYGIQLFRRRESMSAASAFPPTFVFIGLYIAAVAIGWLILPYRELAIYAFPPWHFVVSIAIPLLVLAFAAHRLGVTSGFRALVTSFSWGALGAISVAMILEIIIGAMIVVAIVIVVMMLPNSEALVRQWSAQLDLVRRTNDLSSVSRLLDNPAVIGILLLYVAILVPIAEEAVKTLVVAFIDPRRTRLADALLWGLAAGAGFAIVENLFNGANSLSSWVVVVVLRVGAAMMHLGNGALMGRGWYFARVERRWGQLGIAYLVAVFLHGVWNAAAVLMSSQVLVLAQGTRPPLQALLETGAMAIALGGVLVALTGLQFGWLVYAVRSAQSRLQIKTREGEHG